MVNINQCLHLNQMLCEHHATDAEKKIPMLRKIVLSLVFILIKIVFQKRAKYLNVNVLCATSRPGQNNSSYSSFLLNRLPNARTDNNNGWNYVDKTMKTHKKRQNFELKSIDKRQTTQLKSHMCHCPCQTLFIQSKAVACPRDDAHRCRMYKTPWSIAFLC